MSDIIRDVRDIEASDRQALEHVLGMRLHEHQKIIISVLNVEARTPAEPGTTPSAAKSTGLPAWCNVYEGMSDDEVADVEAAFVRSPGGRSFE